MSKLERDVKTHKEARRDAEQVSQSFTCVFVIYAQAKLRAESELNADKELKDR